MTKEQALKEVDKLYTMYITDELHAYVLSDLLNYVCVSAYAKQKQIANTVDTKSKTFQVFRNRSNALDNLRRESNRFTSVIEPKVKEAFSDEDFDEQIGAITEHMKSLFTMTHEQIHMLIMATKMIKNGKIPTYFDMQTLEKQEIAKKANIPAEHVIKVLQYIPDVCINSELNS